MSTTAAVDTESLAPEVEQDLEQDLEPFKQKVAVIEKKAKSLSVTDDLSEAVALEFINGAKCLYGDMEEKRDKRVRPLNTEVKKINDAYRPYTNVLDQLWRATDQIRSQYVTKKQQAIEAANRRAIADAEQKKREEEAKAEAARQEAERLRLEAERLEKEENDRLLQAEMDRLATEERKKAEFQAIIDAQRAGDEAKAIVAHEALEATKTQEERRAIQNEAARLAAVAEQKKLEQQAIKQDAKADIAESKATMVAPTIQVNDSVGSRVLLDGSKVGTREVDDWYFATGLAVHTDPQKKKYAEYYADDTRLPNGIPDRYWLLDLAKLGKDVKNGVPIEGCVKTTRSATTAGRK